MNILICGASGFVGQALVKTLKDEHTLTLLGRNINKLKKTFGDDQPCMSWNDLSCETLKTFDTVINLAGENIGDKRWSSARKKAILQSRVSTTQQLATLCASLGEHSPRLLNTSAIGIYGLSSDTVFNEHSTLPNPPRDFLSEVGQTWEAALKPAIKARVNVVIMRFAVVLSPEGGAMKKLLPSFKLGFGAVLGSGQQAFSWIALEDLTRAIIFLLNHPEQRGVFNLVADDVVTQKQFAQTLAGALHRPCFMHMPASVVKGLFGQMGEELLLQGQRVKNTRLASTGFNFKYPTLNEAFEDFFNQ